MVRDIKDLQRTIIEAFEIANSGRKGPVLIDIPKNVQSAEYEYIEDLKVPSVVKRPRKSECGSIDEVVEMIKKAKSRLFTQAAVLWQRGSPGRSPGTLQESGCGHRSFHDGNHISSGVLPVKPRECAACTENIRPSRRSPNVTCF